MRVLFKTPQPAIAIAVSMVALAIMVSGMVALPAIPASADLALAALLGCGVVISHRYPIHVRHDTNVYVYTVPAYLCVVLLHPALATLTIALATVAGELSVRNQRGGELSDVTTQAARWTLIAFAGSYVAHLPVAWSFLSPLPPICAALLLWAGDIISSPLLLSPITGESPLVIVRTVAWEAGPAEAGQYLIGLLGAVAAEQALWTLVLLLLPIVLIYRAFKSARDVREHTRQLLSSVVDTSPDLILLLDAEGRVMLANQQAASIHGDESADALTGQDVVALVREGDRERLLADLHAVLDTGEAKTAEYFILRPGGMFPGEVTWSRIADGHGEARAVSCVIRDITTRKEATRALEFQALHDALTGLPNRILFDDRVGQAVASLGRDRTTFSVFLMDLNRFKQVNDTYGHQAGDGLLQQVADRLVDALRDSDTVARLGGDEFAVLLPKADADGAAIVADRLIRVIDQPFVVDDLTLDIGLSIGIAQAPEHGTDARTLLEAADAAMYEAKRPRTGSGYAYAPAPDSLHARTA